MNEILNSKFVQNLKDGILPTVEISIKTETLVQLFGGLFLVLIAAIIAFNIFKKLA